MKREEDHELWDLLGKAEAPPVVSPFLARNVLREIRRQPTWRDRFAPWLWRRRLIPVAATALAVVTAAGLAWHQKAENRRSTAETEALPESIAQLSPIDFEVVADLDDLIALEEDGLWTDPDVSTL